jgi:ATP-dependent DNA helicase RecG
MAYLEQPLTRISIITEAMQHRLKRLGIETVGDLLYHFPTRYEDYSETVSIIDAVAGNKATFEGTLLSLDIKKAFRKQMHITEAILGDKSGTLKLVWFNQRHIATTLSIGANIRVSGKVTQSKKDASLSLNSPVFEFSQKSAVHTGRLVPIYPETIGLTSKFLRWQISLLLKSNTTYPDPIPKTILDKLHLPSLTQTIHSIHMPRHLNDTLLAHKRIAFDEMLFLQLKTIQMKRSWDDGKAMPFPLNKPARQKFIDALPFVLTDAQAKAIDEITHDLLQSSPMNRLLNGDVGSGKTIVAAIAALQVASSEYQVVLLAPTEVLAQQHFENFTKLFAGQPFEVALFTHTYQKIGTETVSRETILQALSSGIARIIIATHTVLQKTVRFHNLSLIIVDEQHRFGVAQRAYLQQEATTLNDGLADTLPHFLTMTATPIPRTLALTFFGNLNLSVLDELPKNRKPILTRIAITSADRKFVYHFIEKEIASGRQAFVILPFIETSLAMSEIKAAIAEHERLSRDIFPNLRIGLLHGKLKAKEKDRVMQSFKAKELDILVATSVVEVGIDIPNASIILIEDADRFGLSQLHQFRGRVGRGKHQSYCFLFPGENAHVSNQRLQAMVKCQSGFDLAEKDLALRGAGALFGTRQSGMPDIAQENMSNAKLIHIAQEEALALLNQDPFLAKHPLLAKALQIFNDRIHFE